MKESFKKIFPFLFTFLILLFPLLCLGLSFNPADSGYGDINQVDLGNAPPLTVASAVVNIALGFLGILFLILTIYGGFIWMTASGNEENITKAKKILTTAVVGLVIILASYGISSFVFNYVSNATEAAETP
ncbi:MAG: pilin [Patescibacteria group bacterium]